MSEVKMERGYQMDEVTYPKRRATLTTYMCTQGGRGAGRKINHKVRTYKMDGP